MTLNQRTRRHRRVCWSNGAATRIVLGNIFALFMFACQPASEEDPASQKPPDVRVITLAAKAIPVRLDFLGQTEAALRTEVRSRLQGIILKQYVPDGTVVKKG